MGIRLIVRRLLTKDKEDVLTKDKVDPGRHGKQYYVYTHGGHDRPHYYDLQGQRHYVDDDPRRHRLDDDHQEYYVDDDGQPRYPWLAPWQENPS